MAIINRREITRNYGTGEKTNDTCETKTDEANVEEKPGKRNLPTEKTRI